ncbi:MAG: NACHT domain-containing protein [Cyanobacteria bacterium P01_H01_bin.153]
MQEELPRGFLVKMAREYGLTSLEEDAFVETFYGSTSDAVIIKILGISLSAYRARMRNIYVKFSYSDGGRGKRDRLKYFLCQKYSQETPDINIRLSEENLDSLVNELNDRLEDKLLNECGSMRVLNMTSPLELSSIFTEVNVLEQVSRNQRLKIDDLLKEIQANASADGFDRLGLGHRRAIQTISGLELVKQQDKLLIVGKPGAGKTTFLKHIALQCYKRKLFPNLIPIFITLKDFAEKEDSPSLLEYVIQELSTWKVHDYEIEGLFKERRVMLLLDGLDEVKSEDLHRVNHQIQSFANNFHGNRFILTCRVAAQEYVFENFTEVEVADFNDKQIETFTRNWFLQKETPEKGERFIERLRQNPRIQELATNPLLLTLLCLVFEDQADFPASRVELYKEGVYTLLRKWDTTRNIERGQIYQELSIDRKIGMLSNIAIQAFEQSKIFFCRETLAEFIANYIVNLPDKRKRRLPPYEMLRQGEVVLRAIEAQHGLFVERAYGIYSFSHLSFQEYFAAIAISSEYDLERLLPVFNQVRNKQWNEVFLLAVNMSLRADHLVKLMKQKTDEIVKDQSQFVDFLNWVNRKSEAIKVKRSKSFIRAFYFIYSFSREEVISPLNATAIHPDMDLDRSLLSILNALFRITTLPLKNLEILLMRENIGNDFKTLNQVVQVAEFTGKDSFLRGWQIHVESLEQLINHDISEQWRQSLHEAAVHLKTFLVEQRDIGHDWHFREEDIRILREYYNANQLLLDCLNGDCYVSFELQRQIKERLFCV